MKALILAVLIAIPVSAIADYDHLLIFNTNPVEFPQRPTIDDEYARLDRDQAAEEEREYQRQQLDYQRKMLNELRWRSGRQSWSAWDNQ